jgi:uncharacterized protein YndB with AHSA1/START domain
MLNAPGSEALEREIFVEAGQETVYSYFTDAQKMQTWKGQQARLDPRPGGEYWVNINGEDQASGNFLELDPFERIVFTWGWEGQDSPLAPGASRVEVRFISQTGGTLVRLKHFDLDKNQAAYQGQGWDHFLPQLAAAIRKENLNN